jgi:hypothetical protein
MVLFNLYGESEKKKKKYEIFRQVSHLVQQESNLKLPKI